MTGPETASPSSGSALDSDVGPGGVGGAAARPDPAPHPPHCFGFFFIASRYSFAASRHSLGSPNAGSAT